MNLSFHWGLDGNSFYIESSIIAVENLRYMTDDFWEILLELKSLGAFEFREMGWLSPRERLFFENKTSTVFRVIRNYMLYQTEKMDGSNHQQPPFQELGQLILKWDIEAPWETLLDRFCKAFKVIYNINYQLWKIGDLSRKKSQKSVK